MRIWTDPLIYEIHTSTYLLCLTPRKAPNSSKKLRINYITDCLPYTAFPPGPGHVTVWTPSSFPLLASNERFRFYYTSKIFIFLDAFVETTWKIYVSFTKINY